jgi:myosin heavy subunit
MNPCQAVSDLYTDDAIRSYTEDVDNQLPPHIYKIAEKALQNVQQKLEPVNQSIIVSGESGAGKTWTTRSLIRYLTTATRKLSRQRESLSLVASIEQQILDSNPILEAFGNAATVHNDNSSRFGKYVQLQLSRHGKIVGASIQTYLLEKVRVVRQSQRERNYHIFYQMLSGLHDSCYESLGLNRLYHETVSKANRITDAACFSETTSALSHVGFTPETQSMIFSLLAAIVHLNSIEFEEAVPGHRPSRCKPTIRELRKSACCLGIDHCVLANYLVTSQLTTGKGEVINKLCTVSEAIWRKDCLAKCIYERLFHWIVQSINKSISAEKKRWTHFIGLLDVYGFENFSMNSLEQLCINYANERLQQLYVSCFLKAEQEIYQDEGLDWQPVVFADNRPCVDLISSRMGVFSLLDEECRLNRNSSPVDLCHRIVSSFSKHDQFSVVSESNQSVMFGIHHYAGTVLYNTTDFLDKNQDLTPTEMIEILKTSSHELVQKIATGDITSQAPVVSVRRQSSTVVSKFKRSLGELMNTLQSTTVHFIRCIRPNASNDPEMFDNDKVSINTG